MHPRVLVLSLVALGLAPALRAAAPQFWRIEGARAFLEGELEGVTVDSDGRLRLGPAARPLFDPEAPNAWCVARDARGTLYVGTGNEGRVVRIEGARGSVLFDAEELGVHAVAVGPDGRVYAATSPDGAVWAIDPASGQASRFFDPAEKYVWALAFDASRALYVATGGEGRVYRVQPDGSATTVLASTETHVLSLAVAGDGRVYAGSAPEGLLYRLSAAGRPFVVFDSPFREIKALAVGADGSVYAAAIDGRAPETTPRPTPPAPQQPQTGAVTAEVTVSESFAIAPTALAGASAAGAQPQAEAPPKGALLRVRPSGDVDTLWTSPDDVPHAAAWTTAGVLVGTGGRGKLYRVGDDRRWSLVATLPAEQVTGILASPAGGASLVTASPARVMALDAAPSARGSFVSRVKDADSLASWGRLAWDGEVPPGAELRLETRAGNTASPDTTWTDWSPATAALPATSEKARFLQVRLELRGTPGGASPTVEAVSTAYLQRNQPPTIQKLTVHPAGEAFQKPITASGEPEVLGLDVDPLSERAQAARPPAGTPPAISYSRKLTQRGLRTFSWQAEDPNGDALLYDVHYRSQGEHAWRPLRTGLAEPVFAWDTATVPSGRYQLRITATDAPGNPRALALTSTKETATFEVDNTPPTITASVDAAVRGLVRVQVQDDASPLRRLELSVDAGPWEDVHPEDGIADAASESYRIEVPSLPGPGGRRLVVLRASDLLGNAATARVDLP